MKKTIIMIVLAIFVIAISACSNKDIDKTENVFKTEDIISIVFCESPDEIEVPNEYMLEITEWLESFTIGEKVKDNVLAPGSNSVSVRIEYSDGSVIENGLSTIKINGKHYYLNHEDAPACFSIIMGNSD